MNLFDVPGRRERRMVRVLGLACLAGAVVVMAHGSPAAAQRRQAPPRGQAPAGPDPALLASGSLLAECARWQAQPPDVSSIWPISDDGRARDLKVHRAYVSLWQSWSEELQRRMARRVKRVINNFSAGEMTRLLVQASDAQLRAVRAADAGMQIEYADHLDGMVCGHVGFRAPATARPVKIALPAAWRASAPADDATWWCVLLDGPQPPDYQYEYAIAESMGHDVPADVALLCESGTASCMLRGNAELARNVARLRFVRWIGRFEPGYKIDPTVFCPLALPMLSPASLRALLAVITRPAHADVRVTVEILPFEDAASSLDELTAFVAAHGTVQGAGTLIATVRIGDLARIASHPAVRDIVLHHEITPGAE
jgi:hypothetical protein